jgi:tripartite-type tricarboxylate transporter receptor subunit TctC
MKRPVRVVFAVAMIAMCGVAAAQSYPVKPVTIVVPFAPGGGTDTGARIVAQQLNQRWGQSVIIENKPGAAGIVGVEYAARSAPDGYRLLMGNLGTQSVNPSLYKLPYNADAAFAPISLVAELPNVLVVNPALPVKTVKELLDLAKRRPAELLYSSSGAGGSMHLAAVLVEDIGRVKLTHVPYKGGGPAIQDLIGGHVQLSFPTVLETSSFIRAGRLRALGVTSEARSPALPDVPTLAQAGLAGYSSASWIGLLAPAGTPDAIITKVAGDVRDILGSGETRERLIAQGATPVGGTPAQFKLLIDAERKRYARMIDERGIRVE